MLEFIEQIPKANRHLHLTGALSARAIRHAANAANISADSYEPLEDHFEFFDPTIWAAAKQVTSTEEGLLYAVTTVLQTEQTDNVQEVELTLNPHGMIRRGLSVTTIATILQKSSEYGKNIGTGLKVKFGVNRKDGPETIDEVRAAYEACPEDIRYAIDLNGDERTFPTEAFAPGFYQLALSGIPTTVHAGEFPDLTASLRSAIAMKPQRIGHAVAAIYDPYAMKALASEGIVVEAALTSNVALGAVSSIDEHPLPRMLDKGVQVVLGTDDPAFFATSMSQEYTQLQKLGLNQTEIGRLIAQNTDLRR